MTPASYCCSTGTKPYCWSGQNLQICEVYVIEATCHAPDVMCIPNSNTITLARMAHHFPLFKYTEQIIAWTVFCCI
nr:hypothetical protein CFP56_16406 [Quercus suber]